MGFALVSFLVMSVVVGAVRTTRRRQAMGHWSRVAAEQGWELSSYPQVSLRAKLEDAIVVIEPRESDEISYIHFSTGVPAPFNLACTLQLRGQRHSAKSVGRAVELGEPFDDAFQLQTSDEDLARAWFHRPLLRLFRTVALQNRSFSLEMLDGRVTAKLGGKLASSALLLAVGRLIAMVAHGGRALLARWVALAKKLDVQVHAPSAFPPPPIVVTRPACIGRIELMEDSGRWLTRLTWTPIQSADFAKEVTERDLPGIVVDGARIAEILEEGFGAFHGSAPYR